MDISNCLSDREYLQAHLFIMGKSKIAFVESDQDIPFWESILTTQNCDIYKVSSDSGTRGKTVMVDHFDSLNELCICALDSDFDFLCDSNSEYSHKINHNPFILQTFVHSKESLYYQPSNFDACIGRVQFNKTKINFSAETFFKSYSSVIFEAFKAFLFLKNKRISFIDDKVFYSAIIHNEKHNKYKIDENYCLNPSYFEYIENKLSELNLEQKIRESNLEAEYLEFSQSLLSKDFNSENAIFYIKGHMLEDCIVNPLVFEIYKVFCAIEGKKIEIELKNKANKDTIKQRKNEVKNILHRYHFKTLIYSIDSECFKASKYMKRILEQTLCN